MHPQFTPKDVSRFWSKVDTSGECWLWTAGRFSDGYGTVRWHGKARRAHRVAWEVTHGPISAGLLVCHHCDTPLCVRPDHLFLALPRENSEDMVRKGRSAVGDLSPARLHPESRARGDKHGRRVHPDSVRRAEQSPTARLTWEQVRAIRATYDPSKRRGPLTTHGLARRFGVSHTTIRRILAGATWVDGEDS